MAKETVASPHVAIEFDPSLCCTDIDLAAIEGSVAKMRGGQFSFLFTGLSGSGKSAFARHLAKQIGMDVLEKRTSDILGMYVGESEAKIAEAFCEASEEEKFLIFDEADSLLFDRRGASRSWEVTQVNEMLTWMENHPLPFAATSNIADRLDPAVQRRFTFKARFGAMQAEQVAKAFHHYFGMSAPADLLLIETLTPGDFAVVARQARLYGITQAKTLMELLEMEASTKGGVKCRIGFG